MASYDVAIIGGGAIGSAIAYFLAAHPGFDGTVAVIERDPGYRTCSTTLSAGSIRQQFSTPANIEMSKFAAHFVKNVAAYLSVDGEAPELSFVEGGYLFLATARGLATLEANHRVQTAHGADVALLTPAEVRARFPWLEVSDLAGASLGLSGEGWLDPYALLQGFRRKARSLGAVYVADEVVGMDRRGGRIAALRLASGESIGCGVAVNAAGPRAARIVEMAGGELPVRPRKRTVFVVDCRTPLPGCPLIIDASGVYLRPESGQFICGVSPPPDRDPDTLDLEPDYGLFEEIVWPTLARRIPAFEALRLVRAWAGHYAYNTFDRNAILGPHPAAANLILANGFTGHGLQQSPAVGRGIAELIVEGAYRSLDLSVFEYARIPAGRPVAEINVI